MVLFCPQALVYLVLKAVRNAKILLVIALNVNRVIFSTLWNLNVHQPVVFQAVKSATNLLIKYASAAIMVTTSLKIKLA
jgi:hypothetical protein